MKEIPILFNGEMVRAILEGRKTQTSRPVKDGPDESYYRYPVVDKHGDCQWFSDKDDIGHEDELDDEGEYPDVFPEHDEAIRSPFGQVGDRLWVRENFRLGTRNNSDGVIIYAADGEVREVFAEEGGDGDLCGIGKQINERVGMGPCRPSIHMPRWASRITLEVTDIRVQRVQEISEEDAIAEGIDLKGYRSNTFGISGREHRIEFSTLWQSIYNTWDANPWVWAATFEVVK